MHRGKSRSRRQRQFFDVLCQLFHWQILFLFFRLFLLDRDAKIAGIIAVEGHFEGAACPVFARIVGNHAHPGDGLQHGPVSTDQVDACQTTQKISEAEFQGTAELRSGSTGVQPFCFIEEGLKPEPGSMPVLRREGGVRFKIKNGARDIETCYAFKPCQTLLSTLSTPRIGKNGSIQIPLSSVRFCTRTLWPNPNSYGCPQ